MSDSSKVLVEVRGSHQKSGVSFWTQARSASIFTSEGLNRGAADVISRNSGDLASFIITIDGETVAEGKSTLAHWKVKIAATGKTVDVERSQSRKSGAPKAPAAFKPADRDMGPDFQKVMREVGKLVGLVEKPAVSAKKRLEDLEGKLQLVVKAYATKMEITEEQAMEDLGI